MAELSIASGVFRLCGTGESVDKVRDGLLAVMLAGFWLGFWQVVGQFWQRMEIWQCCCDRTVVGGRVAQKAVLAVEECRG